VWLTAAAEFALARARVEEMMVREYAEIDSDPYDLLAVVCHDGSLASGHYIIFVRAGADAWLRVNDSMVSKARAVAPWGRALADRRLQVTTAEMQRESFGGQVNETRAASMLVYAARDMGIDAASVASAAAEVPQDMIVRLRCKAMRWDGGN
jgi:hypothetical protein